VEEDADERMDLLASPFGSEMSFSTLMSEFPRYSSRLSLSGRKVVIAPVANCKNAYNPENDYGISQGQFSNGVQDILNSHTRRNFAFEAQLIRVMK
jgi:hypothetical protein